MTLEEHEWRGSRGAEIAMVFQEPITSPNPEMRAAQFVETGPSKRVLLQRSHAYAWELFAAVFHVLAH